MGNLNKIAILVVAFFVGVVSEVSAQAPESAREAVIKELASLAKRLGEKRFHTVFGARVTGKQLEKAAPGTACLNLYNVDIDTLAIVDYRDLLDRVDGPVYSFPVIYNGRPIGEIRVREEPTKSGNYKTSGKPSSGSARLDRLVELQNAYPSRKGFTVALIQISHFGYFYVVFKEAKAFLMTPIERYSRLLKIEPREDERYPLISVREGIQQIKENYNNRYIMPLDERLEWADLVIVGEISYVRPQYEIVMLDTNRASKSMREQYDYGVVEIKEVLMGHEHLEGRTLPIIGVAFYSPSRSEGAEYRALQGFTDIKNGDDGIWILRRGTPIGFWTVHCGKCFLPISMRSQVMDLIHQKGGRIGGASSSN